MDLKKAINYMRRQRVSDDRIYLILALIESDAARTPFFTGLTNKALVQEIIDELDISELLWLNVYKSGDRAMSFVSYLEKNDKFTFDADDLETLINAIKNEGEENYGFKKFVRVDERNAEEGNPGPGSP